MILPIFCSYILLIAVFDSVKIGPKGDNPYYMQALAAVLSGTMSLLEDAPGDNRWEEDVTVDALLAWQEAWHVLQDWVVLVTRVQEIAVGNLVGMSLRQVYRRQKL